MSSHQPDFSLFTGMLKRALGGLVDQGANRFVDLMADDAIMEFPFAPPPLPSRLQGRDALQAHMELVTGLFTLDEVSDPRVHHTTDRGVVILEYTGKGHVRATNAPYHQRYISVITVKDGRITHFSDYWNPLAVLATLDTGGPAQDVAGAA